MSDLTADERAAREGVRRQKCEAVAKLYASAQDCTGCGLHRTRTRVVFGTGNAASPLMLIGEGPGANEDVQGEPFVGRAGKLLDECLFYAGMKREHIYLTNIIKCRAAIEEGGRVQNRPPTAEELDECVPRWLRNQMEIIQPLVICCIGAPAAKVVINSNFSIMRERGRFFECSYSSHAIAVLHPAFILRQEGAEYQRLRGLLIDDLKAAKERAIAARSEAPKTLF
ncbi:MAG: uracil-DNA glycosylase [Capsulimonadaceae bacterium]|nr:uracil-DNA glycosylase [Capsulimonadaceae bacterium]